MRCCLSTPVRSKTKCQKLTGSSVSCKGRVQLGLSCRAYVFVIRFKFVSVDDRDAWFKKFKSLAEYVAENEPTTLAYEAAVAEDDPLEVLCYERYAKQQYQQPVWSCSCY